MKWNFNSLYKVFSRKKVVDTTVDTKLARCLSTLDLTALGIGSTLGVGVYVVAGSVAKTTAGPAVVLSFAIAAVASAFAGMQTLLMIVRRAADFKNWKAKPIYDPDYDYGTGGFAPYGIAGILAGAAQCFYCYIGFDCVATTGEEAKNPQRSIPIAIISSLAVVFLSYFAVSMVLTTVLPYYDQNPDAPFPHLFDTLGWVWAKWLVSVGAICALCSSMLGSIFPLPRVIYAMSSDGLIFSWMGKVSPRFQTPLLGTMFAGLFTGILAAIFDLSQLIEMMSIGTLLAYSIVAACVLILRYEKSEACEKKDDRDPRSFAFIVKQLVNANKLNHSTKLTSQIVTALVSCYVILCFGIAALVKFYYEEIIAGKATLIVPLVILAIALITIVCFIYLQPVSGKKFSFSVPFVPFLPTLSILINIYLMLMLNEMTWIRFVVWTAIGLSIYFFYGVWNSKIRQQNRHPKQSTMATSEETTFSIT